MVMAILDIYLNGYLVGEFKKAATGAHSFSYDNDWLNLKGCRPISLSMPLSKKPYSGDVVYTHVTSRCFVRRKLGSQSKTQHELMLIPFSIVSA
jgi:hypothetical protein